MTDTFEATLARIVSQKAIFEQRDERAVEIFVVLPLLRQVGWNTEDVLEIYPQHGLSDGSRVDYDLQIEGESRLLIEVKRWWHILNDEDEEQLARYCRSAKPRLAVLTSGRNWRLFLPPNRGKSAPLRRFLEFDITTVKGTDAERTFAQFLAHDSMVNYGPTIAEARKLHNESKVYQEFKQALTKVWGELPDDQNMLAELILVLAEKKGIPANRGNVIRFIESIHGPLVNNVTTPVKGPKSKPARFALPTSPTVNRKTTRQLKKPKGWNNFLLELCELMQSRHPETFRQNLLSMTDWFAASKGSKFEIQVGLEEVYAKWGGAEEVRDACYEIVAKFGYPRDSLVIKDSKGAVL